jgi:hypothetical protein
VVSRADDDLFLFRNGPTPLLRTLEGELSALGGVRVVVIDSASLVFDDNEIERRPVAAFMRGLDKLAQRLRCAIILIAHTSRSSDRTAARMSSGSTSWTYQARAGLLLSNDEDGALLEPLKPNYSRRGLKVELRWTDDGVLVPKAAPGMVERIGERQHDQQVLDAVKTCWFGPGDPLSKSANTGERYLPRYMHRKHGMRPRDAEAAMVRLLDAVKIATRTKNTTTKLAGLCPIEPA